MVFIYVLQLKENKWYIGKTETSKFRIDTHFDSAGSEFTKKYPPEEIYQIIPECDKYDEDKYVKKYMDKYGIDNVRGGTYCRLELTSNEKEVIQKELWGANDLCFLCGGDHFVKDCPNNKQVEELVEEQPDERLKWIEYYEDTLSNIDENSRNSHIIKDCEYKLYMLKNEKKEESELKLSKTLTNKINTNKQLLEENFNKILYKIDEIMNNIPELVIAYNMGWGNQNIPSNGGYIKPAEEYKPHKVIGFEIKNDRHNPNKNIDIIICYEHLRPGKYQLYTKDKNNLDIKLKPNDPALICSKLNELGFKTKYTGNYSGINLNTIQNESFAIILEE
tara:strand:- start:1662 stop:2663 length:1002 start_codon:yes stop_codon:yes gene_type:complete